MRNKFLNIITGIFLIHFFILLPIITHAQPGFGDNVDDVPVDGGLSLLIAAGIGYSVKKLRVLKK